MTEDQNILEIDAKIKSYFEQETNRLPEYRKRLDDLRKTLRNLESTNKPEIYRCRTTLIPIVTELEKKIEKIVENNDLNFYLSETMELVDRYKELLNKPKKVSFMGKVDLKDPEKIQLVTKYIHVVQKYQPFFTLTPTSKKSRYREEKKQLICDNCEKTDFIQEENCMVCVACSVQKDLESVVSYRDSDRSNTSMKYSYYDGKVHFRDCINQYQGKQNCTVDQQVYTDLENILERHHLLLSDTDKQVRFSNVEKEHVLMFLKELGYVKHYENVVLIHHVLTGKKPDDISHLEDRLLQDFDVFVSTYEKLFKNKTGRKNFLNYMNLLYQLLVKWKHPCKKKDFNIMKTIERKNFHDSICAEVFRYLSWNYVSMA